MFEGMREGGREIYVNIEIERKIERERDKEREREREKDIKIWFLITKIPPVRQKNICFRKRKRERARERNPKKNHFFISFTPEKMVSCLQYEFCQNLHYSSKKPESEMI